MCPRSIDLLPNQVPKLSQPSQTTRASTGEKKKTLPGFCRFVWARFFFLFRFGRICYLTREGFRKRTPGTFQISACVDLPMDVCVPACCLLCMAAWLRVIRPATVNSRAQLLARADRPEALYGWLAVAISFSIQLRPCGNSAVTHRTENSHPTSFGGWASAHVQTKPFSRVVLSLATHAPELIALCDVSVWVSLEWHGEAVAQNSALSFLSCFFGARIYVPTFYEWNEKGEGRCWSNGRGLLCKLNFHSLSFRGRLQKCGSRTTPNPL